VRRRLKRKQGWLGNWKNGVEADFFTHFPPDFYSLHGIHLYLRGWKKDIWSLFLINISLDSNENDLKHWLKIIIKSCKIRLQRLLGQSL
jgi:hypothetical protein